MRARTGLLTVVGAASVLLMAESAQAQTVIFGPRFGGFGGSSFRPVGFGGFTPSVFGGGFGPGAFGYPGFYGPGYGYPGYGYPGAFGPFGYGAPGTGWGGWPYSGGYESEIYFPGWTVTGSGTTTTPRRRATLAPALAVDPERINETLRRQLEEDKSKQEKGQGVSAEPAALEVTVPAADAEVWLEGVKMLSTGATRSFVSPALASGSTYVYTLRVRWQDQTGPHETSQAVDVRAGARVRVDLTAVASR